MISNSATIPKIFSTSIIRKVDAREMVAYFFQLISCVFVVPYFRLTYSVKINGKNNLRSAGSSYIIVSNHISHFDSFIYRLIMTPEQLPLRFMGVVKFRNAFLNLLSTFMVTRVFYFMFGVLVVTPGLGSKNLEEASEVLRRRGRVVVYAEGRVNDTENILPFRPGAVLLSQKFNTPIIPVSLRLYKTKSIKNRLVINIGSPIKIDHSVDVQARVASLFERVCDLYNSL